MRAASGRAGKAETTGTQQNGVNILESYLLQRMMVLKSRLGASLLEFLRAQTYQTVSFVTFHRWIIAEDVHRWLCCV